ncbi:site-2 protease family protein [Pararhodospirillum oryzae]|uniref:Peptidase M50 n=1 Tax=Pararhodospirillum oryzae TaxID=478448 RepID=A0A512HAT8_9PROT|nr:site-2 protease family protein [Pararhodospirillum oryzae]GEO82571.1 peptidase M50 [Pararhodospirillum oryzae]
MADILFDVLTWLPGLVLAITLHEAAHGYVANWKGDPTARLMGRLSLNPLRHVEPFGTLILPGLLFLASAPFLFGWARPVPIDPRNLKAPRRDMAWIALAGPGMNVFLAVASAAALHLALFLPDEALRWIGTALQRSVLINCVLAVFNMIPLPPLDGGRLLVGVLPLRAARAVARLEPIGLPLILGVLFLLPLGLHLVGISADPFSLLISPLIRALVGAVYLTAGLPLSL